jgi:hypothetical protein
MFVLVVFRLPAEQDDVQCYGEDGDYGPDDAEYPDVDFVVTHSHTLANEEEEVDAEREELVNLVVGQGRICLGSVIEGIPVLDTLLLADKTEHEHGDKQYAREENGENLFHVLSFWCYGLVLSVFVS